MKYFMFFLLIFAISGCKEGKYKNIDGKWGVIQLIHNDDYLVGNPNEFILARPLFFDYRHKYFFLEMNFDGVDIKGKFKIITENNIDYLVIYDSTDSRFNGKYTIELKIISNNKSDKKELVLKSKNVNLIAKQIIIKRLG